MKAPKIDKSPYFSAEAGNDENSIAHNLACLHEVLTKLLAEVKKIVK